MINMNNNFDEQVQLIRLDVKRGMLVSEAIRRYKTRLGNEFSAMNVFMMLFKAFNVALSKSVVVYEWELLAGPSTTSPLDDSAIDAVLQPLVDEWIANSNSPSDT
jgi:hypothetical protein